MDRAVGFVPSLIDVEQHQLAHPCHAVMSAHHGHELPRTFRHGPRVEHGVGPIRVGPVVFHLFRAVRIHVKQDPRHEMRDVRVLPPQVQYPAVRQHRRTPVVVLVEGEPPDRIGPAIPQKQVRHVRTSPHARHTGEGRRRSVQQIAVGEVARVVVVDAVFLRADRPRAIPTRPRQSRTRATGSPRSPRKTAAACRRSAGPRRPRTRGVPACRRFPAFHPVPPATGPQSRRRSCGRSVNSFPASLPAFPAPVNPPAVSRAAAS